MNDQKKEYEIQRKREYHRKWRAEHQDSVRAAQMRYWMRNAQERQGAHQEAVETRQEAK